MYHVLRLFSPDSRRFGNAAARPAWVIAPLLSTSRVVLAVLLVFAAAFKMKAFFDVLFRADPSLVNWLVELTNPLVATWELLLAVWLVSDLRVRLRAYVVAVTFAVYAAYIISRIYRRAPSCNCLGALSPSLQTMLIIDVTAAIVSLVDFCTYKDPATGALITPKLTTAALVCAPAIVSIATAVTLTMLLADARDTRTLDPYPDGIEIVAGMPFPVAALDSPPPSLGEGDWVVVFHRPGCRACDNTLKKLQTSGPSIVGAPSTSSVLLVSISSAQQTKQFHPKADSAPSMKLTSTRSFVRTPTVCHVRIGRVISVFGPSPL